MKQLVSTIPMTDVTSLSEIDGSEFRVTVEARVADAWPMEYFGFKQKGQLRDGSQKCTASDGVHFVLCSDADATELVVNRSYKIKNARTKYETREKYHWAPQTQIMIDGKSIVTVDEDTLPDYDEPTTHNPSRSAASNPLRSTPDSDLTKDLKLNNGGI